MSAGVGGAIAAMSLPRVWAVNEKGRRTPSGHASLSCRRLERYLDFAQSHPPPQRQPGLQAQRSPHLHGSTGAPAHPQEAFWHWQVFSFGFSIDVLPV